MTREEGADQPVKISAAARTTLARSRHVPAKIHRATRHRSSIRTWSGLVRIRRLRDEPFAFQHGETELDCAGAGHIDAAETGLAPQDEFLAKHRLGRLNADRSLIQVPLGEDRPIEPLVVSSTKMSPLTVLVRRQTVVWRRAAVRGSGIAHNTPTSPDASPGEFSATPDPRTRIGAATGSAGESAAHGRENADRGRP